MAGAEDFFDGAEVGEQITQLQTDLAKAKHALSATKKDLKNSHSHIHDLQVALDVHRHLEEHPPFVDEIDEEGDSPSDADGTLCVWTDWHSPEIVRPEEVGGRNEHNPEIGRARAHKLVRDQVELLHEHMRGRTVRDHVVPMLGDFLVNREMHEDSTLCVDMTPLEEMRFCRDLLIECIQHLVDHSDVERLIFPMVWGNHGRSTVKARHARSWAQSFEYEMYTQIIRHFDREEEAGRVEQGRLHWLLDEEPRKKFTLAGMRFQVEHGDRTGFKYGGGVGGIQVPFRRRASEILRTEGVDYLILGHWHTEAYNDVGAILPSLVGVNSYAAGRFQESPPGSLFFTVSPKYRRIAAIRRIFV